jgi:hypothetical protein
MACCCFWFIHPATAITTNRNGFKIFRILAAYYLLAAMKGRIQPRHLCFQLDPVFGYYAIYITVNRLQTDRILAKHNGARAYHAVCPETRVLKRKQPEPQKRIFNASCVCRGAFSCAVTVPNAEFPTVVFGIANTGEFVKLNHSARNCTVARSRIRKFL